MTIYVPGKLTLDNGLRPQAIAGVAPTLDYRFAREKREIETVSLLDKLTYTGGNGTFVGSDGYIQPATTNAPRFDHDPLSRVSEGLLVEESRENLLLRSEEFDNASWIKTNALVVANAVAAPDGSITANKLIETTDNGVHAVTQGTVVSGLAYVLSVYAKAGERANLQLSGLGAEAQGYFTDYNLLTGVVTSAPPGSQMIPVGNGWYRCILVITTSSTAGPVLRIRDASGNNSYTGDGTSGLYLWGAQLEAGSTPSTYIPTTASTVTRTADSATIDGTGILTGTYTIVEKPAGCAVESGGNIELQAGYTTERVMVFPASLSAQQITDIRSAM